MAKKSLKHQSKSANTANFNNSPAEPTENEPSSEELAPNTNTAAPADSPPVSISSPSTYKPITDTASIERLIDLAKDSPPDSALGIVWKHAYDQGYQKGRIEVLQKLGKKLEEKFVEGEKEGMIKGKEKYYGKGIVRGESDEHKRWISAGHSNRCFMPAAVLDDAGTQTDPIVTGTTTTTSTSTQTSSSTCSVTSQARTFVENGVLDAHLAHTVAVSAQTTAFIVTAPFTTSIATQTDPPATATSSIFTQNKPTSSVSCQTQVLSNVTNTFTSIGIQMRPYITHTTALAPSTTQTNPVDTILGATTVHFIQTNTTSTPSSCQILHPSQPSSTVTPITTSPYSQGHQYLNKTALRLPF